jgi:hypothetical protein
MPFETKRAARGLSRAAVACVVAAHLVACSSSAPPQDAPAPTSAKPATNGSSSASALASGVASSTTASTVEPAPAPSAVASAAPSAAPSSQPAPAAPLPDVEITNIGMHIGGGPHDAPTKEPIKLSVAPHFDSFRSCFAKVDDAGQAKGGDVSADLFVPRAGGKVTVKKVTTSLSGEGFKDCVKSAFEAIDFRKPKGGDTVVSYSLRFKPAKKK